MFEGWRPLITEWSQRRKIIYVETREKASARFDNKMKQKDFTISMYVNDIAEIINKLGIEDNFHLFSSSLGSTIIIHALQERKISGKSSIFLAPNQKFRFPIWAKNFNQITITQIYIEMVDKNCNLGS